MKRSEKDMVLFRNSRKGYDKTDVNRYIEDMNIRFTTAENHYVSTIRMLERDLENAKAEPSRAAELQAELDLKYTVEQIEADARDLGMVKRQYADTRHVALENEDEIVIYDDGEQENVGLSSLLSAFGIDLKD